MNQNIYRRQYKNSDFGIFTKSEKVLFNSEVYV